MIWGITFWVGAIPIEALCPNQIFCRSAARAVRHLQRPCRSCCSKHHTARATLLARIALAGRGMQIQPDPPPPYSPGECRKLVRDALRLTIWRATCSTGAWLVTQIVARKRADCGV